MAKNCPSGCEAGSNVYDTREEGDAVRRRRQCPECGARWTTWETTTRPQNQMLATVAKHLQEVERRSTGALSILGKVMRK